MALLFGLLFLAVFFGERAVSAVRSRRARRASVDVVEPVELAQAFDLPQAFDVQMSGRRP
jgi:hypothetical protein